MSTNFLTNFVLALGFSSVFSLTALGSGKHHHGHHQGDHHHDKGPRGGDVVSFGNLHMEAVIEADKISLHVLGADGKSKASVGKHEGGSVTVIVPGQGQNKTDIPPGDSFGEISVPIQGKGNITVLVRINADKTSLSARFNLRR